MSIATDSYCFQCQMRRNLELVRKLGTEEKATEFLRGYMKLVLEAPEGVPSPWYGPGTADLLHEMYGLDLDRYRAEKEESNRFVLAHMPQARAMVEAAADPVFAGLQFAILGNYLDFSALQDKVSFDDLEQMLADALKMELDMEVYAQFRADLEKGKNLLYVTDNAGEIGFDRIFAEEIQKKYPHLSITFCVRGGIAANDATREDAETVGIPFTVVDNGNRVAGTVPELMSEEARAAFARADVILSKGMGNVETLYGCGMNIYYAFLVKCERFIRLFDKPLMTPMFVREK